MPTVLTREHIKEVDDTQFEFVKVPEWAEGTPDPDAGVWVRGLTGTDRDAFDTSMVVQRGRKQEYNLVNLRARLIVRAVVNVDIEPNSETPEHPFGKPIPSTAKPFFAINDVEWLGKKSSVALTRVEAVARRLSGLSAEEVEELTKELGEAPSDGSGTDSLSPLGTDPSPMLNAGSAPTSSASGKPTTASSPSETVDSTSS